MISPQGILAGLLIHILLANFPHNAGIFSLNLLKIREMSNMISLVRRNTGRNVFLSNLGLFGENSSDYSVSTFARVLPST